MTSNESKLVHACLSYLAVCPQVVQAWRANAGTAWQGRMMREGGKRWIENPRLVRLCPEGCADIIGLLHNGRFLAVECKIGRNKPTEMQAEFLARVARAGGLALVVYDVEGLADDIQRAAV